MTRFVEIPPHSRLIYSGDPIPIVQTWHYDKTEDEKAKSSASFWNKFDYILIEPGEEENQVRTASGNPEIWAEFDSVEGFAGLKILRPGDEAVGLVEERLLRAVAGSRGLEIWNGARDFARRVLTRGWWVEVRMEPKIKILRRVG